MLERTLFLGRNALTRCTVRGEAIGLDNASFSARTQLAGTPARHRLDAWR